MAETRDAGPTSTDPFSKKVPACTPGPHGCNDAGDPNRQSQPGDTPGPTGTGNDVAQYRATGFIDNWLVTGQKLVCPIHAKSAEVFFAEVWKTHKIVLLGECHDDDVQRIFAADMIAAYGGPNVGLAIEVDSSEQDEIDYYLEHRTPRKGAKGFWTELELFKRILTKAADTKTKVIAMDTHPDGIDTPLSRRDAHMTEQVLKLAETTSHVLVYVGGGHVRKAETWDNLAKCLAKLWDVSYSIMLLSPTILDHYKLYKLIKQCFPAALSIGFDIVANPLPLMLAYDVDELDMEETTLGEGYDGFIYFQNDSKYK